MEREYEQWVKLMGILWRIVILIKPFSTLNEAQPEYKHKRAKDD